MNRNRLKSKSPARANGTQSNLAAIGDENPPHRPLLWLSLGPSCGCFHLPLSDTRIHIARCFVPVFDTTYEPCPRYTNPAPQQLAA
jgi:hypothetical protein